MGKWGCLSVIVELINIPMDNGNVQELVLISLSLLQDPMHVALRTITITCADLGLLLI